MKKITDYAELVKAKHALNKTIAPVEDGANIAGSYTSGKQFIRGGVLYTALTTIAENTAWSSLTLDTDYELADDLTSQLASLNQTLTNEVSAMVNVYGSKNILQNNLVSMSQDGVNFVVNEDKSITIDTNGQTVSVEQNGVALCHFVSEFSGDFILSHGNATLTSELKLMMEDASVHEWAIAPQTVSMVKGHTYWVWIIYNAGLNIAQASAKTIFPMLRDARIIDGFYQPYSMTNQELTPIAQAVSNRNLLDNPWFTVNQRGANSYTTSESYCFDRWKLIGGEIDKNNNDGITLKSTVSRGAMLDMLLENDLLNSLLGKTVTMSILMADGTIYKNSGVVPSTIPSSNTAICRINDLPHSEYTGFWVNSSNTQKGWIRLSMKTGEYSNNIRAVKLELGSVSTLAMDTPPNYAEELLKCQRYFVRIGGTERIYLGTAISLDNDKSTIAIKLPTDMRTLARIDGITNLEVSKGSAIPITALDSSYLNNGYLTLIVSSSGTVSGSSYFARVKPNSNIDFVADL